MNVKFILKEQNSILSIVFFYNDYQVIFFYMLCLYYYKGLLDNHFNELCENIFGLMFIIIIIGDNICNFLLSSNWSWTTYMYNDIHLEINELLFKCA